MLLQINKIMAAIMVIVERGADFSCLTISILEGRKKKEEGRKFWQLSLTRKEEGRKKKEANFGS
ncbi:MULTISPECIES: hypothetical protein [Okeania]|nr:MULTISPECIES: hypothetical protein [Okeania]NET16729.1 hypothetical protein [Okeania sp. SIO1H6]NES76987.1 hypothetical protein [Okeania sp. SIO1H4]NET20587.1 hypothetical protein [Okeania sp. SIO1H5]NET79262.1 hypothetical protein [Okeania sp. SIO1F9]NET92444.1 hypothetical protein [Okeania sp. SIO1H2]